MAMNELQVLDKLLSDAAYRAGCEIQVDPAIGVRAKVPLDRMLDFQRAH
jgi:quinolinate synthase